MDLIILKNKTTIKLQHMTNILFYQHLKTKTNFV